LIGSASNSASSVSRLTLLSSSRPPAKGILAAVAASASL
jgi:hypothetical protein